MRAGATLLYDSDPDEEEAETRLKASAFLDALSRPRGASLPSPEQLVTPGATSTRVLLVDHEVRTHACCPQISPRSHYSSQSFLQDSFVHALANYMRQTGATVVTLRAGFSEAQLDEVSVQRTPFWCCRFCSVAACSLSLNSAGFLGFMAAGEPTVGLSFSWTRLSDRFQAFCYNRDGTATQITDLWCLPGCASLSLSPAMLPSIMLWV